MFVRAVIKEGVDDDAILVSQQGVSRDTKGNPTPWWSTPKTRSRCAQLTLDRAVGNQWIVVSGLAPGDRVIVEGLQMLRPGTEVRATPVDQGANGQAQASQSDVPAKKNGGGEK
jgi:membrane fusion protein (multidrug efflux system)